MKHLASWCAAAALWVLASTSALAATGTITVIDGQVVPTRQVYQVTVLPGGNFLGNQAICDPTVAATCAAVNGVGLKVDASGAAITITGAVTVAAGTNLNTSALALEAGGHLAALDTSNGAQSDAAWTSGNGSQTSILKAIANASTAAAVKPTGTSSATTDQAVVVAPSPNPSTLCLQQIAISQTASTDLKTSTNKLHICGILIVSATAQSVALTEGTGSVCATGAAALMGSTTVANGMALAANGGWAVASERAFMATQTSADHLCLLQSGAGNVSGFISYTDHN